MDLAPRLYRGEQVAWGSVLVSAYGQPLLGLTEIAYDEERDSEAQYGAGSYPQGIGNGNVKYTGSLKMYRWQVNEIIAAIQAQGGNSLSDGDVFVFTVVAKTQSEVYTDTVYFKFKKTMRSIKQGDKMDVVDCPGTVVNIIWSQQ